MKISKELLEKYHRNECTAAERGWVEEWLFSEDADDELILPDGEDKEAHKKEIWNELMDILPEKSGEVFVQQHNPGLESPSKYALWQRSIAAALVLGLLITVFYAIPSKMQPHLVTVDNTSSFDVKYLDSSGYDIAVGPNTEASINYHTGIIDFSGSLMISPKRDIRLIFHGDKQKMDFKMGETYIILRDKTENDKMIVVNERNLLDLPPVIQKHIVNQFNI